MQEYSDYQNDPSPKVKCIVNTCLYHTTDDYCNAEQIQIQPKNARNNRDTDCATFTHKK